MKTNKFYTTIVTVLLSVLSIALTACGSDDDDNTKDMTYPVISDVGITANPIDCQVYNRGSVIPFNYIFSDDTELGSYNIEIHNNFDHHTHSTSSADCTKDEDKKPVKPWIFNQDYQIPAGLHQYNANFDIPIPADIDPGDYHFMVRLIDRAGWQQLKAVAVKIK